jgi:pyrimidine-nucleoside phosphorylase
MRIVDLIDKKKNNSSLTFDEIQYIISSYVNGDIPDYQISAFLMAVYFNGMSQEETSFLTKSMIESGETIDLSFISGYKMDKHSTGGVGDKVSLIIAPIVASFGVPIAKMSGRGLGNTGGTIDKLESIPNFKVDLSKEEFAEVINKVGFSIISQTGNIVPADKKLYALRDVTGTVNSIPLIASSVMSKKIASGADGIILDVKFGKGAFMEDIGSAKLLAQSMINIASSFNKKVVALLTDMNQPLGRMVGNALEVKETLEVLSGNGEKRITDFCVEVAAYMLIMSNKYTDLNHAKVEVENSIQSGKAKDKFLEWVEAQGGDSEAIQNDAFYKGTKHTFFVRSKCSGYVESIDAAIIGHIAMISGAGRETKEDMIDYQAGIELNKLVGDVVQEDDVLMIIFSNKELNKQQLSHALEGYSIVNEPIEVRNLIFEVIQN